MVNKLSQFRYRPICDHWNILKWLLWYLCGTPIDGLLLYQQSPLSLNAFFDADWAVIKMTILLQVLIMFTWVTILFFRVQRNNERLLVPQQKPNIDWLLLLLQNLVGFAYFLIELRVFFLSFPPIIYYDNVGVTNFCANLVFYSLMKNIALD